MPMIGRFLTFKIRLERQSTSSSWDALARKDALVTGVTRGGNTVDRKKMFPFRLRRTYVARSCVLK